MSDNDDDLLRRELQIRTMVPGMPGGAYPRLVGLVEDLTLGPGEVLFSRQDQADHFYLLTQGSVVLERDGERPWPFEAPASIGVIDAVLERPRARACRSVSNAAFFKLPAAGWFDLLEDNAQVARASIRNFAGLLNRNFGELAPVSRGEGDDERLASDASTYGKTLALHKARFLERAGLQAVASLASIAEHRSLAAGEVLLDVGGDTQFLHVVTGGSVELVRSDTLRHRYRRGELVGGGAALCGLSSFSARAVTEATVLSIPEQSFYDEAEEHARLTRGTLAYLASELERAGFQALNAPSSGVSQGA